MPGRLIGWAGVAVCALYAGFAFVIAGAHLAGADSRRAAPPLFVAHAVTGGVALLGGALQLRLAPPGPRRRRLHRLLGRAYVGCALFTSAASVVVVAAFDTPAAATIVFWLGSSLWFATTTLAYLRIRSGRIDAHREWMIRSFALAFFFVTFSLWVPLFAATPLPEDVGYPLAVFLSWALNLGAAQAWITRRRSPADQPAISRAGSAAGDSASAASSRAST